MLKTLISDFMSFGSMQQSMHSYGMPFTGHESIKRQSTLTLSAISEMFVQTALSYVFILWL